ncbi:hypothetical protein FEM03_01015 [Phragmitibacter flavus]|uniref:Uncharacterized protein n=1 Tax=Phragmitibacter flavus TaxID=2576071 RepID=A0A5R8KK40_9BACT|nr:hypothetical protein [Phragmitibacter flavus]TLD72686.1 hypothetical protein FEM03_01015 [Phragmitibacter flavus]
MSESVSKLGLGYAAMQMFAFGGSAVSNEAQAVQSAAREVVSNAERAESLFGSQTTTMSEVWKLADDCALPDWDGDGAMPIDELTVGCAVSLIRALPVGIPMPEVAPEPDGSISFDWIRSRYRLFSLSVSNGSRLSYAWLDGSDKGHAVAFFDGWKIPARIEQGIRSIL